MRYTPIFLLCTSILAGCTTSNRVDASNINDIKNLQAGHAKVELADMRYAALRDVALSVGARAGLAYRAGQLNEMLEKNSRQLERAFNFNSLIIDQNVLPPVLTEGRNTLEMTSYDALRISDRSYSILKPARFVTAAPSWRDYLYMPHQQPETPDTSLLPRNGAEQKVWKHFVDIGYEAGLKQADQIYEENLASLKRDYRGILLYVDLLERNMVTKPFVAKIEMGITGGGDDLTVGDRVLRITEHPSLNANAETWNATASKPREARAHG